MDTDQSDQRFWAMWMTHERALRRRLGSMFSEPADADDVLGAAMLKALVKFDGETVIVNERAWLLRLTYTSGIDYLRSRRRRYCEPLPDQIATAAPSPEEWLVARQNLSRLDGAIAHLPNGLRTVLQLRVFEQMDYAAIAARLGISNAAARKRVQAARDSLRDRLA